MKINLVELYHQKIALNAIINEFPKIDLGELDYHGVSKMFENPTIKGRYQSNSNIDIKMETGTGKTYVGTRMMYELHQKFGLYKFIVIVPSPAIKEGWKNFLTARYSRQHFAEYYENVKLDVNTIYAGDFNTKSGRRIFPPQLNNFIEGTRLNTNQIEVLLINVDMLKSKNMTRDDYNQTLLNNYSRPFDALKATKPIIIIDEPHRFPRDKKNYQVIEKLKPQVIIRFGATFPEMKKGTGKKAINIKDYYRGKPQFELNAIDSFNQGLVKGVDIYYPKLTPEQAQNRYTVDSVKAKEIVLKKGKNRWTLGIGENLANVDSLFEGDLSYAGAKTLSNNLEISKGMDLLPGTFTTSYQELIINDAINQHFEHEINNFMRDNIKENFKPKVKTLSLFFIDSIRSYRNKDGWLKQTFERLLKVKLRKLIKEYEAKKMPREIEYLDFLKATYNSLNSENQMVHAGYFGEDRGSGEEAIQAEINDILKNKERMLSFKDSNGNWITRRFLFSKWTLREGWDNPNVFVIAKLRTSGSENSKIQEVGRGLRLPVDETGHRLTQDEFPSRLSFLIGYDERDFAEKLIGEINSDVDVKLNEDKLTDEMINKIVKHRQQTQPDFNDDGLFVKQQPERVHQSIESDDEGKQNIKESISEYNSRNEYIYMNYGKFLKQLVLKTKVPISIMHKNLLSILKFKYNSDERFLSELSLNNIIREFNKRFEEKYSQSYEYKKLDFSATTTIYDSEISEFKDWVDANYLGTNVENNIQTEKRFLYERPPVRYDSVTPELELLKRNYDKNVIVFGNLPKKAIQVPKYTGGTTTPDFIYMIETDEQDAKYLIVETKAENMRLGDKSIGEIQKKFFNTLDNLNIKYQLATSEQDVYNEIKKLDDSK
ncbi:TPA: type III restriction-modification system endonuclease [Staphylococcus aureus]|nr:type III restriction-modification system endonuclease [Staphylococcus aureus]